MSYERKHLLVHSILMAGFMAFFMSGCLSVINFGFEERLLPGWGRSFLIAWPLAFVLSLLLGKRISRLSHRLLGVKALEE